MATRSPLSWRFGAGRAFVLRAFVAAGALGAIRSGTARASDLVLPPAADRAIDFDADVRPLLEARCVECHAARRPKNELRLDSAGGAIRGGISGPAVVAGDALASLLIRHVAGDPDLPPMPPKGDRLSAEQIGVLRAWVEQGAKLPASESTPAPGGSPDGAPMPADAAHANAAKPSGDEPHDAAHHWAFKAPARPEPPAPASPDLAARVRNPIDAFVFARLEREGLAPSSEADRATLARRLHLDLTGLPPSPEEVDAFVADAAPDAYERLVDRLLASPAYGERQARPWLDLARHADTNGYEKDRDRPMWPWRDWVVKALNDDMPYDRFVVEQIAGDMLPGATRDQLVATGFHRNTLLNEEGGIDVEQFRWESVVDRVATTGAAVLGLTTGCAQCHDHKYDPISHREYWSLFAFLNDADEPELPIPTPEQEKARREALADVEWMEEELPEKFPPFEERIEWRSAAPARSRASGTFLKTLEDGSVLAFGLNPEKTTYELEFELPKEDGGAGVPGFVDAIRIEALTHDSLPGKGPGRADNGNFVLCEIVATVSGGADADGTSAPPRELKFASATADHAQKDYGPEKAIDGVVDPMGWAIGTGDGNYHKDRAATFRLAERFDAAGAASGGTTDAPARLTLRLEQVHGSKHVLGRVRVSFGTIERLHHRPELALEEQRRLHLEEKLNAWIAEKTPLARDWKPLAPTMLRSELNATLTPLEDLSVLAEGDKPNKDTYYVDLDVPAGTTGLRLETLLHETLSLGGPGRGDLVNAGNFMLNEFLVEIVPEGAPIVRPPGSPPDPAWPEVPDSERRFVKVVHAQADYEPADRPAAHAIDGVRDTGWTVLGAIGEPHAIVFELESPVALAPGERLRVSMLQNFIHQETIGRFRLSATDGPTPIRSTGQTVEVEKLLHDTVCTCDEAGMRAVRLAYLRRAPEVKAAVAEIEAKRRAVPEFPKAWVMRERAARRTTRIHTRGEYLRPGVEVTAATPAFLPPLVPRGGEGARPDRLDLARWLVDAANPLTARVVANRLWQSHFGRGLVATPDDFGLRGEAPSHPELLDWLATEMVARGWSMKAMHRLIVESATYRQSSRARPDLLERDPANVLLARAPRLRLEAEAVRDAALAASGLLSAKMGGPPVRPPQPPGVSELSYGSPRWTPSEGEDRYRRGLYTYFKRTSPYPTFLTFDAPPGDRACARRERSNTPLQALALLDDEVFVEAAQALARRVLAETTPASGDGGSAAPEAAAEIDTARARRTLRLVIAREPASEEVGALVAFAGRVRERLVGEGDEGRKRAASLAFANPEAPPEAAKEHDVVELAAWTAVARAALNLDEAIVRE